MTEKRATLILRIAFTLVFIMNVMCALQFIIMPAYYAPCYQLSGTPGVVATQGLGIAFLMWNTTYPAYILAPKRFQVLGPVILVQQAIGLFGETAVLLGIPAGFSLLSSNILRFIIFDGAGLVIMVIAFVIFYRTIKLVKANDTKTSGTALAGEAAAETSEPTAAKIQR